MNLRKLIESTLVSLGGVVEAPERWANLDDEATALALTELGNFDALVMGRVTFEMLSAYWGDNTGDPYVDAINAMPKHVASRSLTETAWNATLLGPDVSSAIARLKDQPGKHLIKRIQSLVRAGSSAIHICRDPLADGVPKGRTGWRPNMSRYGRYARRRIRAGTTTSRPLRFVPAIAGTPRRLHACVCSCSHPAAGP